MTFFSFYFDQFLAYDKAVREQRILAEVAQAKKENSFYMENVDKAKLITNIKKQKDRKHKQSTNDQVQIEIDETVSDETTFEKIKQKFRQRKPVED